MLFREYRDLLPVASAYVNLLYDVVPEGLENVPAEGAAVLAPNHLRRDDPFILGVLVARAHDRPITFGAKAELFDGTGFLGPQIKAVFEGLGQIPIERTNPRSALLLGEAFGSVLKEGGLVAVFPESTTSPDGLLSRFRTSIAQVALDNDVQLNPTGIIYEPRGIFKRPRARVLFGEPILPSEFEGMNRAELTAVLQAAVLKLTGQKLFNQYRTDKRYKVS